MNPSADSPGPIWGQNLKNGSEATSPERANEIWRRLDSMSQLLYQAARAIFALADRDGPTSPLHSLGLGIYLAHGQTQLLLAEDTSDTDTNLEIGPDLDVDAVDVGTAAQLLAQVEELSRPLPLWRIDLVHGSQLVDDLRGLLREAQHLDC